MGNEIVSCLSPQVRPPPIDSDELTRGTAADAGALAQTLFRERDCAARPDASSLTRTDTVPFEDVDELQQLGANSAFDKLGARLDAAHPMSMERVSPHL